MTTNMIHPKTTNKYGETPVTNPHVLEGMKEYWDVVNGVKKK